MLNIFVRQLGYPFRFHNVVIVGHLMLGKTDRFAKIIIYFLRGHTNSKCEVDKRVNLGDKRGMQVPCEFHFVGKDKRICLLKKEPVGEIYFEQKRNCMNFYLKFE